MNNLLSYIYAVMGCGVILSIIEMILPEGNSKKYVKLVCGIILTFVVLTPIISFLNDISDVKEGMKNIFASISSQKEEIAIPTYNSNEYIENVFLQEMKNDVRNIVNTQGYDIDNIEIKYNRNENNELTNITYISFEIVSRYKNEQMVVKINNVKIMDDIEIDEPLISKQDKNILLEIISERYLIDKSNINII